MYVFSIHLKISHCFDSQRTFIPRKSVLMHAFLSP